MNISKRLKESVKNILDEWDPIGVYDEATQLKDEYDGYIYHICRLIFENSDIIKIETYLNEITKVNMGLLINELNNKKYARKIFDLRNI